SNRDHGGHASGHSPHVARRHCNLLAAQVPSFDGSQRRATGQLQGRGLTALQPIVDHGSTSACCKELPMAKTNRLKAAEGALRRAALAYPDATEDFPWGHSAFKIKGKGFLFTYREDAFLSLSLKLPVTGKTALGLPFASPTGYGLGKSGWVTARFDAGTDVPIPMLLEWLDESFRAVAPKRVVALL